MSESKFKQLEETIKSFVSETASKSLSRVHSHIKNRNVGFISANRNDLSNEENNKNHESLKKDIRSHGFGYVHVKGTYPEKHADGSTKQGEERSFMITSKPEHKEKLHKTLMKLGKKYNQDSVAFKGHDDKDVHLHTTTARSSEDKVGHSTNVGTFHPGRISDYMTQLKGKRNFVFESATVEWHHGYLGEWQKQADS